MKMMLLSCCALAALVNPLSYLNTRSSPAAPQSQSNHFKADEIPTVSYCEMLKDPQAYFGKPVRTRAVWERATEGIFLRDRACEEQAMVGFSQAPREQWCERAAANFKTIYDEKKFEGRAEIIVVGTLENRRSKNPFFNYRYLFVATCIEKVMRTGEPYEGTLEEGQTYKARVKCNGEQGPSLLIPVRVPYHHAWYIEWVNLEKFPQLKRRAGADCEREIVFQVLSRQIVKVEGQYRWNTTYNCKILEVE